MPRQRAISLFRETFGREPELLARAPGRVNLIGEHVDYAGGLCLPAAIDRSVWVAAAVADENAVISSDRRLIAWRDVRPDGWAKYAWATQQAVEGESGLEAAVASDLPAGAGISSSAALEVAFACLWNEVDDLSLSPREIALCAQRAESEYVGMPCGAMDQLASALGQEGHALLLDCRTNEAELIPMPDSWVMVVCDTGKKRTLVGSPYKDRRESVEEAEETLGRPLRDAAPDAWQALPHELQSRARHVQTEIARTTDFARAMQAGDDQRCGDLLAESHASLRDDFTVSCPELDAMAEACAQSPGCIGARMMGGGFGGSCISLVLKENLSAFLETAEDEYRQLCGEFSPAFYPCAASQGAGMMPTP